MLETLPPLSSLHAFVLVAETGSLAAAAERLNVTQPAVSKRIRVLEAHLGVALVRRGANALCLTEQGKGYAAALASAFAGIRDATAALDVRGAGPLRVRAYTTWALRWLIPRLSRFRERHPGLEVEVTTSIAPVDFARDPVDAAIRNSGPPPAPGAERLHAMSVAPFAAPALARGMKLQGLKGMTLLGSLVRPQDWGIWAAATGTTLASTPLLFESTSLAIEAAIGGLGAVIVPPLLVAEDTRRRRLAPLARGEVATGDHYWLVLPPGPVRPEALAFRAWLREEIAAEGA
ncbi:MAG: LysR family transcriptional regulator [Rubritepida sp.]|nr:LysR family transcriptional regulator [Rubritepida sp.]